MQLKPLKVRWKKLHSLAKVPTKNHAPDAAYDLYAVETVTIQPGEHSNVGCGVAVQVGEGWSYDVRGRSGLNRKGILVSLGLVDAQYSGELRAVVSNFSGEAHVFQPGDRVAQIKFNPVFDTGEWIEVEEFEVKEGQRGAKGWGSSGR